jgi:hypothetical protein
MFNPWRFYVGGGMKKDSEVHGSKRFPNLNCSQFHRECSFDLSP